MNELDYDYYEIRIDGEVIGRPREYRSMLLFCKQKNSSKVLFEVYAIRLYSTKGYRKSGRKRNYGYQGLVKAKRLLHSPVRKVKFIYG